MSVRVSGITNLQNRINSIIRNTQKQRETLELVGSMFVDETLKSFETETSPFGEQWRKSKRALKEHGQTLYKTGILRGSVSHRVQGNTVKIGANARTPTGQAYGRFHQFGTSKTPKRAFLPVNKLGKIPSVLQSEIIENIRERILGG